MASITLDEQLRRAFALLADRVRDDLVGRSGTLVEELTAAADAERADAAEAAKDTWSAAEREAAERLRSSVAHAEAIVRADAQRRETAAAERLLAAIHALDRGQSLSEILHALVDSAAAEATRAAIFLRKDARLEGWRLAGFGDLTAAAGLEFAVAESGLLGEAVRTGTVVRTRLAPAFAALPADRPAVAIPLVMSGQVIAVLYADQGTGEEMAGDAWVATLEVLARHASRALEAVTALRLAQISSERSKLPEGMLRIRN